MLHGLCRGDRYRARAYALVALAVMLAGCATRPGSDVLAPVASAPGVKTLPLYAVTNRQRAASANLAFTAEIAPAPNYAEFVVTIPPDHKSGNIEWPRGKPDPRVNFATIDQSALSDAAFREAVAPPKARGKRHDVVVFIHGYNNNFQESLYRLAQMAADSGINAVPVLFAWPSQGRPILYDEDKQAALASRDELMVLLTMVAGSPQVKDITVVAHSMGTMLTMAALRELRLTHKDRVIARLGRVVLAAPDIDIETFRADLQAVGPLKPPLTLLVAKDDGALQLSSAVNATGVRAGALDINNPLVQEAALKARVRVIDISQVQSARGTLQHDRFVNLAALYPQLQRQSAAMRDASGTFVFDVANAMPVEIGAMPAGN
jgi:esterase/lipase superfamily enzyme